MEQPNDDHQYEKHLFAFVTDQRNVNANQLAELYAQNMVDKERHEKLIAEKNQELLDKDEKIMMLETTLARLQGQASEEDNYEEPALPIGEPEQVLREQVPGDEPA